MLDRIKGGLSVGFFGLGKSSSSLISTLPLDRCDLTIRSDKEINPADIPKGAKVYTGEHAMDDIREDILFLSPSVKRERFKECHGVMLSSDYELFLSENKRPIFAVTGSDGKSTTTRLVSLLLRASGQAVSEVGNIGEPMVARLSDECDIYVAELSSFMLDATVPRAKMAALTSLTPNHLDWHGSYENYKKTKISLLKSSEKFVISDENADITSAYGIVSMTRSFTELTRLYPAEVYLTCDGGYIRKNGEKLIALSDILRSETHNIKNLMLAIAMCDGYVREDEIRSVAQSFKGLPHRCEKFLNIGGIDFYDSSIDTSPARTAQTLRSLDRRCVIILGGRGKGLDYGEMKDEIKSYAHSALLVGENKHEIYSVIKDVTDCYMADDLQSAVDMGCAMAGDVGLLLLSPASASYDMFKDFEERGRSYQKLVRQRYGL